MTVTEYVKKFNSKAFLFKNNLTHKWQYFIPLCEYDEVIIDNAFDQDTPTVLVGGGKIICSIKQLIGRSFLEGDEHIFIVPNTFEERPNLDIVDIDSTEPTMEKIN